MRVRYIAILQLQIYLLSVFVAGGPELDAREPGSSGTNSKVRFKS
jgi:hypothetical protein